MARSWLLGVSLLVGVACTGAPPQPRTHEPPRAVASVPPLPALAPVAASDAGKVDAGSNAPPEPERVVRASLSLGPGLPPCSLVFRAGVGTRSELGRYLMAIDRIETEASDGCAAQVVFDSAEKRPGRDLPQDSLEGGLLPNPGKLDAAAAEPEGPPPLLLDANFDGYLDLCVLAMSGAYNQSFRFWLFDPTSKRFVSSTELEDLLMPRFDAKRRRVEAGGRAGGPIYVGSEHEWVKGKLETVWSETVHLGETPTGASLPKGFTQYKIRYERRGGKQRKVFDGPSR